MAEDTSRRQLAEFLKSCRARLEPGDVGLPDSKRRRTPGLRREDVAALAGVSVTWYTWLEQGREIRASAEVLENIASTLRMSGDEREYLFGLVQHRPAPLVSGEEQRVRSGVRRMMDALNVPALVANRHWDVIEWNDLAAKVFEDYSKLPLEERNILRHLLLTPAYHRDDDQYREVATRVLAQFRVDYSQAPNDQRMNELVEELSAKCPVFDEIWYGPKVTARSYGINEAPHPIYGHLSFEHTSYVPEGSPTLRMMVFIPNDDHTAAVLAELRPPQPGA